MHEACVRSKRFVIISVWSVVTSRGKPDFIYPFMGLLPLPDDLVYDLQTLLKAANDTPYISQENRVP
jgi:hypothetical protein